MSARTDRHLDYSRILKIAGEHGDDGVVSAMRQLCQHDLFFLLVNGCGRADIDRDWLFDRCVEIQQESNGYLDLWARESYKSTIITYGKTIQDILNNPEITVGIFSHTKPIARAFLRQIKSELETNIRLQRLFPEILFESPRKEAANWSEDKGITVKRKTNPKEATVEAHGLVDGQPTSKHFSLLVYDDVVTRESVTTPEMIGKVTDAWALSLNLGADGGNVRTIGTRYHHFDTYKTMMDRGSCIPRIYPATHNGKPDGDPVFLTKEKLDKKRTDQGPYVFAAQMLQDPTAGDEQGFDEHWIKYYTIEPLREGMNVFIICDPANSKKTTSDYTVFFVVGLAPDGNYYILDIIRDRINLTERTKVLFGLHRRWKPNDVIYERYGMQSDIQHIEYVQEINQYRFNITEVGGATPKLDRIKRMIPIFEQKKVYFPRSIIHRDYEGKEQDIVQAFISSEYIPFPVMAHDDMLDCLARVVDPQLDINFPIIELPERQPTQAEKDWQHIIGAGDNNAAIHI